MNWYARPVFFVENVEKGVQFYKQKLGFEEGPSYAENGRLLLGDVKRNGCTLMLNCQQPQKIGTGRLFISLNDDEFEKLKLEFEKRGAPIEQGWWGTDLMVVKDPDGNELFFPYP